mmetsp:Transcript_18208/g.58891  ORF Transcript_18208/g.58891 Transcript_18208/m.58891 type:complete len:263 (+) Transcript_18208:479-1267(+)
MRDLESFITPLEEGDPARAAATEHGLRFVGRAPVGGYQLGSIQRHVVRFSGQIDVAMLEREALALAGKEVAARHLLERAPDSVRHVFHLNGYIRRKRGGDLEQVSMSGGEFGVGPPAMAALPRVGGRPYCELEGREDPGGVVEGTGMGITAFELIQMVRRCKLMPAPKMKLRTRPSLTPAEYHAIKREHAQDPLPDGWMYNGATFVDIFGDTAQVHPDFEKFAEEYLAEKNKLIEAENALLNIEVVEPLVVLDTADVMAAYS